jgi:hypothetical protein
MGTPEDSSARRAAAATAHSVPGAVLTCLDFLSQS